MAKWQTSLLLTIHDTSHFSKGNAAMCHGANKRQKDWKPWNCETGDCENWTVKLWNWGLGNWETVDCETETGKLWTAKLDCETVKLGTVKLGNCGLWNWETGTVKLETVKLWNWDWETVTGKTVDCETVKLGNCGLWNWDCETGTGKLLGLLLSSISFGLSVCLPRPGRLKTLLLRSVFYTLCRQRSANQRSRMPTRQLADQSAIASRRTPLFYRLFYCSPCVIFTKLIK